MQAPAVSRFLALILLISASSPAFSQGSPDTDEQSSGVLEEVLVQASRRGEQDILTTPVSITALSGDEIEKFALRDLNDVAVDVPGLSAGNVSAFKTAQFAMRGVSETTIILYKESPVAVTMDEFVVPHIQTSNLEVFDIESVEVVRGPQGTLFGKNTTGGVIAVRTKRPVLEENSVQAQVQFGDFGTRKANLGLNFGSESVAFRFAGMYLESDGYYKNNAPYNVGAVLPVNSVHQGESGQGDGRDLGGDDVFSGRFKFRWTPNEDVDILLQYEMVRDDGDSPPIVQESPPGFLVPLWGFPAAGPGDPLDQAGSTLRNDGFMFDILSGHQVDIDGIYLNGNWAINDNYTLYFNAGNRDQESRLPSNYAGNTSPISVFDATRDDNRDTTQAEVRLGSNLDGNFNFTAGAYYQEDDTEFCVLQYVGFFDGLAPLLNLGTPPDFFNDHPRVLCNRQDADAQALYFDGTLQASDKLSVTAGIRYTEEDKSWAGRPVVLTLDGQFLNDILNEPLDAVDFNRFPELVVYNSHDWSEPTYRLIFGYEFSDDAFGFFGYSRGFKSGGYNDQVGTQLNPIPPAATEPTEPEIADSLEGGIKTTFADGRATASINAYYVEYTDAQRTLNASFPTGQETLFFNAADMTVKGMELEGAWAPMDGLTFHYNLAYADGEYDKFEADTDFDGVIDTDLSDRPVARLPEWMGSVNGTYTHDVGAGSMEYKLRVSYEDDNIQTYSDVGPEFDTVMQSRTLVDASVTFYDVEDRYFVRLLGSNLTDERYRTGSLSVGTLWIMSNYAPPRYYGLELGMKLDW